MIQTDVGDDAMDPGGKGTLEPKAAKILVGSQERLLRDVLDVALRSHDPRCKPPYSSIMEMEQLLEGCMIAA